MIQVRDLIRPLLALLFSVQVLLLSPAAGLVHLRAHLDHHEHAAATHDESAGDCCPAGTFSLQGPCDTSGPCSNSRHHHHAGRRADDSSPCTQCLRTAAGGDLECGRAGLLTPAGSTAPAPIAEVPPLRSRHPQRYLSRAPPARCHNA